MLSRRRGEIVSWKRNNSVGTSKQAEDSGGGSACNARNARSSDKKILTGMQGLFRVIG